VSQAKRVVNDAQGMCQGIFQFSNQNGSWHGQESAGKKSGNNSQFVGLQNGANVDENLSWHFSPKAGQVEIRKSERPLIHLFKQAKRHQDICRNPLKT
jgi:cytochrome c oxidase assembly protein Cox11